MKKVKKRRFWPRMIYLRHRNPTGLILFDYFTLGMFMKPLLKNAFTPHDGTTCIEGLKGAKSSMDFRISVGKVEIPMDE